MLLLFFIYLILAPCAYPRYDKSPLKAEVVVLEGTQECEADCLDFETKGGFQHMCSKFECQQASASKAGAECPEIEKKVVLVIYKDASTNKSKMRMEFFWTPSDDNSSKDLLGYKIQVKDIDHTSKTSYEKCFHVSRKKFQIHYKTKFRDNCYGANASTEIIPGSILYAEITSIPYWPTDHENTMSRLIVTIPSCRDQRLKNVNLCKNHSTHTDDPLQHDGEVLQRYCHNRSVQYSYSLSPVYGEWAVIKLCEQNLGLLQCESLLETYDHLVLSNVLYNISINSAPISKEYVLILSGSRHLHETTSNISFIGCPVKGEKSTINGFLIFGIIAITITVIVIIIVLYWRNGMTRKQTILTRRGNNSDSNNPKALREQRTEIRMVYVIFTNDHQLHSQTVDYFCRYLKNDLGIDVRMWLWDTSEAAVNRAMYMEKNLKDADRVIVICSRGTRHCLRQKDKMNDMFTPVLRRILNQTFLGNNVEKILVGYFDYSSPKDIPSLLKDHAEIYLADFKLMKQFESFYFRLLGSEQYQEGGVQRNDKIAFDSYYDDKLTKYGKGLKKCIDEMKTFVSGNPTWYIDAKGDDAATLDLPPALWTNEIDIDVSKPISNPTMTTAEGSKDIVELENCERFDVEDMDGSEQYTQRSFEGDVFDETREKRYYTGQETSFPLNLCDPIEADSNVLCEGISLLNGAAVQLERKSRKVLQLGKPEPIVIPLIANMSNHVDRMENENENLEQSTSGPRVILIDIDDCESDNVEYEFGKMNQGE